MANPAYADAIDQEMVASVPTDMRGLRACIPCLLVKTFTQFYEEGCENCQFLEMEGNRDRCLEVTTDQFEGLVSVMKPKESWVGRWIRVSKLLPGCYAIKVNAELDPRTEEELESRNFPNLGKLSQQD
mmetsp:Transcript_49/g.71  ORF Transcript_49/g.71 Transcript_49/m.71 type:complete len:128 (+) Transcript_49:201-584(+)